MITLIVLLLIITFVFGLWLCREARRRAITQSLIVWCDISLSVLAAVITGYVILIFLW